ncbi:ABC transporter permease [Streptomyces sp. NPDC006283]|uniref:ABC transporter permease n=1 Tax=Streptomyces sp. NPDC006283 TaxID=3156741 RepID=UPI0033BBD3E0
MSTPYQHPGAPAGSYASPIPVRGAHLGDALASEWTKIRSVRSTMWTLGVMIALMVGVGLGLAALTAAADVDMGEETALSGGFTGTMLGSICVLTLGVLTITSEYGTGMIRTTLTACPSRGRVLAAKSIVFFLVVFAVTTLTAAVVAAVQTAMIDAAEATGGEWFRATVGVGLFVATLGLLSLAVGTLIRHSAGAITLMVGLMLFPLVAAMFMFSESLEDLRMFLLEYGIPSLLLAFYGTTGLTDTGPSGWEPLWILLGITAAAMGGAFASLSTRDV